MEVSGKIRLNTLYDNDLQSIIPPDIQEDNEKYESEILARNELKTAIDGVNEVVKELGNWRSVVYCSDGTVDVNVDLDGWSDSDRVHILKEIVSGLRRQFARDKKDYYRLNEEWKDSILRQNQLDHQKLHSELLKVEKQKAFLQIQVVT